jgi:hypothetical protein
MFFEFYLNDLLRKLDILTQFIRINKELKKHESFET